MNPSIANEIQSEQNHGRQKYGRGPDDFSHDDDNSSEVWYKCIQNHNYTARWATPIERRQYLIKVAGLAVSAVEAIDRKASKV